MLTWLDFVCRTALNSCDVKHHGGDPRKALAFINGQMIHAVQAGRWSFPEQLDEAFHALVTPFVAPYAPPGSTFTFADGAQLDRPLGIILTRDTARLLTATKNPDISDEIWREKLGPHRGVYIDIPHGAFPLYTSLDPDKRELLQLRAILAAPYLPPGRPGHTQFLLQLTDPGSERGRGRIAGVLCPDGLIAPSGDERGKALADPELFSPADLELRRAVLGYGGTFLRMVLTYYFFGPEEIREELSVTPSERLNKGKPRNGQSLFAMTRLHATDKVGRPNKDIPTSWSLSERQEVSGHFKLQPYGPQQSQRRMIWVSGYERGPEDAPLRPKGVRV